MHARSFELGKGGATSASLAGFVAVAEPQTGLQIMKKLILIILAVGAAALTGCILSPVPPMDSRVTIAPNLGNDLCVTDVRCVKGDGSHLTLQANVVNNTGSELRVQWKVQWLDADGVEIDSMVSTWNSIAIQPYDIKGLKGTAPCADAADMRFYVREME